MNSKKQYVSVFFKLLGLIITTAELSIAKQSPTCAPSRQVTRATQHKPTPMSREISTIEPKVEQEVGTVKTEVKKGFQASGKVISVESMDELDRYIKAGERVIVDVYASWCGPCKSFVPIYEKFAEKYPKITCLKIDGEKVPGVKTWTIKGKKEKVTGYPTFVALKDGRAIEKTSGAPGNLGRFENKIKEIAGEDFLK